MSICSCNTARNVLVINRTCEGEDDMAGMPHEGWNYFHEKVSTQDVRPALKTFIDDCKPDDWNSIQSFFAQGGAGQPYDIHVFCKKGSGRLGEVLIRVDLRGARGSRRKV